MEFLTATILSGVAWDGIKKMGEVTANYLKDTLKGWAIDDTVAEEIAEKLNDIPDSFKENQKFLEVYVEHNKDLLEVMKSVKRIVKYEQDNSNSEIKGSNIVNGNNNITNIVYLTPKEDEKCNRKKNTNIRYDNRSELKKEIRKILAENRAIYKLYGPTEKNKLDLFSTKSSVWQKKALDSIVPNNKKIIQLLQENTDMLTEDEYDVFMIFKLHAEGFEENHINREKSDEYPVFPDEINNILN